MHHIYTHCWHVCKLSMSFQDALWKLVNREFVIINSNAEPF